MFLLIPDDVQKFLKRLRTLHSNMFLLIPGAIVTAAAALTFTFQYVSINTLTASVKSFQKEKFTFQYVSINTSVWRT